MSKQQKTVMNGRGYLKPKSHEAMLASRFGDARAKLDGSGAAENQEEDNEQNAANNGFLDENDDVAQEVQIMELHTPNPVISYRGRIYQGQWSQNVGTELLLTQHEENNPLPAVQNLDGGIDVLAASSARIMVTEKVLKPRNKKAMRRQRRVMFDEHDYELSDDQDHPTTVVPRAEPGASLERVEQGEFLAKLIALKKSMGETDEVTVVAQTTENTSRRKRKPQTQADGRSKTARGAGQARGPGRGRGRARGAKGVRSRAAGGRARGAGRGRGPGATRQDSDSSDGTGSGSDVGSSDEDDSRSTPAKRVTRADKALMDQDSDGGSADDMDVDED